MNELAESSKWKDFPSQSYILLSIKEKKKKKESVSLGQQLSHSHPTSD